ncbi:MAG: hypothetical protein A2498_15925 [Lentisphaerae bacterium RIFOXYC12_FULL_60_16]|nr:MAG: hypothetical protein A2498_15925 [Lentisphaerae bacterium RIFOXYC12_FULL_60_16]OGV79159.1 MAG: hypothetical protein A2340_03365 [Lentisphaerae bacterium RIFOXYB12_FULL_60_10]
MPLMRIESTVTPSPAQTDAILKACSKALCQITGKPEPYTMVTFSPATVLFAGQPVTGAFVDIRGIGGFNPDINRAISQAICRLLEEHLQIAPDHVYLNFTDVPATQWGWNGKTFGT